jgi:hypothetical protein
MKKYLAKRTGRRDFDTAIHDNTVDMMATQKLESRVAVAQEIPREFFCCGLLSTQLAKSWSSNLHGEETPHPARSGW